MSDCVTWSAPALISRLGSTRYISKHNPCFQKLNLITNEQQLGASPGLWLILKKLGGILLLV